MASETRETLIIRTVGGPHPGTRSGTAFDWPLPHVLADDGGVYVKVSESQLPPEPPGSPNHVARGAQYEWQPAEGRN